MTVNHQSMLTESSSTIQVHTDFAAQAWLLNAQGELLDADSGQVMSDLSKPQRLITDPPDILWVPTELVILHQVFVAGKRASDCQKAMPFVLEALLSQPIENYHIVVYHKQKVPGKVEGMTFDVALVSHAQMRIWQQSINLLDWHQASLVPECFRIPFENRACQYCYPELEKCLLRLSAYQGLGTAKPWMKTFYQVYLKQSAQWSSANVENASEKRSEAGDDETLYEEVIDSAALDLEQVLQCSSAELLGSYLQSLPAGEKWALKSLNLRQGIYAANHQQSSMAKYLGLTVVLLSVILLLNAIQTWQEAQTLEQQTQAYKAQTESLFKAMFPDAKRIVNIKSQTLSRLKEGAGQNAEVNLLEWLSAVETLMKQTPSVQVAELQWKANTQSLQLKLQASSGEAISQLSQLAKSQYPAMPLSIRTTNVRPNEVEAYLNVRQP